MTWVKRSLSAALLGVCLVLAPSALMAQDYQYVQIDALKDRPFVYWAKGVVFRDTLEEKPGRKTREIDDRELHRFETRTLGDVYSEEDCLPRFDTLETGKEYYFAGTIAQRGRKFFYIVNTVSSYTNDAEYLKQLITDLNRQNVTNRHNHVFLILEQVIQDVHDDVFKFTTTNGVELANMVDDPEFRSELVSAVRTSLRKFENRSKETAENLLINTIISMMAMQYGHADTSDPESYEPAVDITADIDGGSEATTEESEYEDVSEEEWDLSAQPDAAEDVEAAEAPAAQEPETVAEPEAVELSEPADMYEGWDLTEEMVAAAVAPEESEDQPAVEDADPASGQPADPEPAAEKPGDNVPSDLSRPLRKSQSSEPEEVPAPGEIDLDTPLRLR